MAIAFGILCCEFGKDERFEEAPFDSPCIRLALLPSNCEESGISGIVIGYSPEWKHMLSPMSNKISHMNGIEPKYIKLEYPGKKRHDFDTTFHGIISALDQIDSTDGTIFLHLDSGSFVEQMNMFRIADRQLAKRPSRLICTHIEERNVKYRIPRLGLVRYAKGENLSEDAKHAIEKIRESFGATSGEFHEQLRLIAQLGVLTNEPLLLLGETGTGKTLLAYEVHKIWLSKNARREGSFQGINCAGLDSGTAYSELFGYKKGAFTGAIKDKDGLVKLANKGTLFLDEFADLDYRIQGHILKAIEEKIFFPLGSDKPEKSDFRPIFATNKHVEQEVRSGRLRRDLYYRISKWVFSLPSLRQRSDQPELIRKLIGLWFVENKDTLSLDKYRSGIGFEQKAEEAILESMIEPNCWPGNLREFRDFLSRLAVRSYLLNLNEISYGIVNSELSQQRRIWKNLSSDVSTEFVLFEELENEAKKNPNLNLIDSFELLMQDYLTNKKGLSKAAVARLLYESSKENLANPSAKYSQRRLYLERRDRRKENTK